MTCHLQSRCFWEQHCFGYYKVVLYNITEISNTKILDTKILDTEISNTEILDTEIIQDSNYNNDKLFENIDDLDITTGASSDLKQANTIARQYINLFGINNTIGIYEDNNNPPFLGRELASNNNRLSEYSRSTIDREVKSIINYTYKKTLDIIKENQIALECIADLLINEKTIDNHQLKLIDIKYL